MRNNWTLAARTMFPFATAVDDTQPCRRRTSKIHMRSLTPTILSRSDGDSGLDLSKLKNSRSMEIFPPGFGGLKPRQLQNGYSLDITISEAQTSIAFSITNHESCMDQEARKANNSPGTNSNYFTSDEIRQSILGLSKASVAMETDLCSSSKKQNDVCKAASDNESATISDAKTQRRNGFSNICLPCNMRTNKQTASQLILPQSPEENFPANKQQQVLSAQITCPNYSNNNSFIEKKKHQQKEILSQSQDSENQLSGETFIAEDNSNGDKILASSCSSMNQTDDLENRENCKRGCCQACGSSSAQLIGSILGHSFSAEKQPLAHFAENYGSKHGPCTEACCTSDPVRLDVSVFRPGSAPLSKMFQSIDEFDSLGSLQNQELRTHSPEIELIPRSDSSEKSELGNVSSAEDDDSLNQEEETRKIEQLFQTYTEATLTRIAEIYSTSTTSAVTTKQPQNTTASARFLQPLSNQTEAFLDSTESSSFDENDLLELSDLEEFPVQLSPMDPSRSPGAQTRQKRKRYIHKRSSYKRTHGATKQSLQQTVSQTSTTKTASLELLETFNTTGPASESLDAESPIKKHPSEDAEAYPRDPKFRDFLRKCGSFEHDESSTIDSDRNVYHPQISKRPWDAKLDAASPISSCESFPNPADKIPCLALRQSTEEILSSDSIQNGALNSNSKAHSSALAPGSVSNSIHEIRVEPADSTRIKTTLLSSVENAEEPMWDFGETSNGDQLTSINQDPASYARLAEQEGDVSLTSDSSDSLDEQLTKAESQVNTLRPHFRHATPDTSSTRVHPGSPASLNVDGSISNSQLSSSAGISSKLSPRKLQGQGKLDDLLRTLPATTLDEKIQMLTDENSLLHTETFQNSDPLDNASVRPRSDEGSERKISELADYEESFESTRSSDSIDKSADMPPKNKFLRLDLFHAQDVASISSARVVTDEEINASGVEDASPRISELKQIGVSSNVSPQNEPADQLNSAEVKDETTTLDECKGAMSSLLNICATKKLAASIDSAMSLKSVGSLATSEKQQSVGPTLNETFANGDTNTDNNLDSFGNDAHANYIDSNEDLIEEPKDSCLNISEAPTATPAVYTSDDHFREMHKHSLDAADLEFEATTKARVLRAKSIGSVDFRNIKRQVPLEEFDRDELNVISLLKGVIDKRQASLDIVDGNGRNTNGFMNSGGHFAFPSLVPQDPVMARITVTSPRRPSLRSPKDKTLLPVTEGEDMAQAPVTITDSRETFSPMTPALITISEISPGTSSIPQISPSREALLISTPQVDNQGEQGQDLPFATGAEAELRPLRAATNLMEARSSPNSLGSQLFRPGKKYLNFGERERSISSSAYSPEAEERSPLNSFSQQSNSNDETFLEPESGLMSSLASASDFDALRQAHADQQDDHQPPSLYAVASTVAESLSDLVDAATVSRPSITSETFPLPNGRLSDSSSSDFEDENENQELSLLEILNEGNRHKVRVNPEHSPLKYSRSSEQLTLLEILKEGEELQCRQQLEGIRKASSPDNPNESATFSIEPETFLEQADDIYFENLNERQDETISEEASVLSDHQNLNSVNGSDGPHLQTGCASVTSTTSWATTNEGLPWSEFSHSKWFVNGEPSEPVETLFAPVSATDDRYETFLEDKSKDVKEYNVSVSFKLPSTSLDEAGNQPELTNDDNLPTMPDRPLQPSQHASWSDVSCWHENQQAPCSSSEAYFPLAEASWLGERPENENSERKRHEEFQVDRSANIPDMDVHISLDDTGATETAAIIPEADMPTMDMSRSHSADHVPLLFELNAPSIETGIEQPQWHQCREFSNADFTSIPCVTVSWHQTAETSADMHFERLPKSEPDTSHGHKEVLHSDSSNEAWLSSLAADGHAYDSAPSTLRSAGMYATIDTDTESEPEIDLKQKAVSLREEPQSSSAGNGISLESVGYMDEPVPTAATSTLLDFEEFSEISPDDSTARLKFGLVSIESSFDRSAALNYGVDEFGASSEQSPGWLKEHKLASMPASAISNVDIVVEDITFDDIQEIDSSAPGKRSVAVPPGQIDEVSQPAHEDWEDWLAREVRSLNDSPSSKTSSISPAKQPPPRPPRPAVLTVKQVYDLSWLQKPLPRKTPGLDESSASSISSDEDEGGSRPGQGKKSVTWGDSTGMSLEVGPSPSDHSPIISPRSIIKNKLAAEEIARAQQLAAIVSSSLDENETVEGLDLKEVGFVEKELAQPNVSNLTETMPVESDASKLLLAAADLNNRNILAMLRHLQESHDNLQTMLQEIIISKTNNNHKITRETTIVNKATTSSKIETHVRPLVIPNIASSAVQTEGVDDYNGQIHGEPNVSTFGRNRDVDDVGPLPFLHSLDVLNDTRWEASSDAVWRIPGNNGEERLKFSPAATDIYLCEYKEYLRRKKAELNEKVARYSDLIKRTNLTSIPSYPGPSGTSVVHNTSGSILERQSDSSEEDFSPRRLTAYSFAHAPVCSRNFECGGNSPSGTAKCGRRHMSALEYQKQLQELRRSMVKLTSNTKY